MSLEPRIEYLEARIKDLSDMLANVERQNKMLIRQNDQLTNTLKDIDLNQLSKLGLEANKRLSVLNRKLRNVFNRDMIATETSYYIRHKQDQTLINEFYNKLMYAFDIGDDFFNQEGTSRLTVKEWADKILNLEIRGKSVNINIQSGINDIQSVSIE